MFIYSPISFILAKEKPASPYEIKTEALQGELIQNTGFVKNPNKKVHGPVMGDMSVISMNLFTANFMDDNLNQLTEETIHVADQHNPSFITLQAVEREHFALLKKALAPHYEAIGEKYVNYDLRRRRDELRPIFYDATHFELIKSGQFTPVYRPHHSYGTFGVFRQKGMPQRMFTVVNIDLYSADAEYIQEQLYTIIRHIEDGPFSAYPVILGGMINDQTSAVKKLIKTTYKNTLTADLNNENLPKTTFHYSGRLDDNYQRDFILLKDEHKNMRVNYARILSKFESVRLLHYPVYTIFSFNNKEDEKSKKI